MSNNDYHVEFVHVEANDALVFEQEYCAFSDFSRDLRVKGRLGERRLLPDAANPAPFLFFCIATLFLQPDVLRPDTIVLDEPELGFKSCAS